jgi:hypothetical protein
VRGVEDVLRLLDGLFARETDRWTADGDSSRWDRWSALTVSATSESVVVKKAWNRHTSNSPTCPCVVAVSRSGMHRTTNRAAMVISLGLAASNPAPRPDRHASTSSTGHDFIANRTATPGYWSTSVSWRSSMPGRSNAIKIGLDCLAFSGQGVRS